MLQYSKAGTPNLALWAKRQAMASLFAAVAVENLSPLMAPLYNRLTEGGHFGRPRFDAAASTSQVPGDSARKTTFRFI